MRCLVGYYQQGGAMSLLPGCMGTTFGREAARLEVIQIDFFVMYGVGAGRPESAPYSRNVFVVYAG